MFREVLRHQPVMVCCTMHVPSPSVGHIKRWGDGFKLDYLS